MVTWVSDRYTFCNISDEKFFDGYFDLSCISEDRDKGQTRYSEVNVADDDITKRMTGILKLNTAVPCPTSTSKHSKILCVSPTSNSCSADDNIVQETPPRSRSSSSLCVKSTCQLQDDKSDENVSTQMTNSVSCNFNGKPAYKRITTGNDKQRINHSIYQSYTAGLLHSTSKSEKFLKLQKHFAVLERITEIEEKTRLFCRVAEDMHSDMFMRYDAWSLKELQWLYQELIEARKNEEFFYDVQKLAVYQWKAAADFGLKMKGKSMNDLRKVYEQYGGDEHTGTFLHDCLHFAIKKHEKQQLAKSDLHIPWRRELSKGSAEKSKISSPRSLLGTDIPETSDKFEIYAEHKKQKNRKDSSKLDQLHIRSHSMPQTQQLHEGIHHKRSESSKGSMFAMMSNPEQVEKKAKLTVPEVIPMPKSITQKCQIQPELKTGSNYFASQVTSTKAVKCPLQSNLYIYNWLENPQYRASINLDQPLKYKASVNHDQPLNYQASVNLYQPLNYNASVNIDQPLKSRKISKLRSQDNFFVPNNTDDNCMMTANDIYNNKLSNPEWGYRPMVSLEEPVLIKQAVCFGENPQSKSLICIKKESIVEEKPLHSSWVFNVEAPQNIRSQGCSPQIAILENHLTPQQQTTQLSTKETAQSIKPMYIPHASIVDEVEDTQSSDSSPYKPHISTLEDLQTIIVPPCIAQVFSEIAPQTPQPPLQLNVKLSNDDLLKSFKENCYNFQDLSQGSFMEHGSRNVLPVQKFTWVDTAIQGQNNSHKFNTSFVMSCISDFENKAAANLKEPKTTKLSNLSCTRTVPDLHKLQKAKKEPTGSHALNQKPNKNSVQRLSNTAEIKPKCVEKKLYVKQLSIGQDSPTKAGTVKINQNVPNFKVTDLRSLFENNEFCQSKFFPKWKHKKCINENSFKDNKLTNNEPRIYDPVIAQIFPCLHGNNLENDRTEIVNDSELRRNSVSSMDTVIVNESDDELENLAKQDIKDTLVSDITAWNGCCLNNCLHEFQLSKQIDSGRHCIPRTTGGEWFNCQKIDEDTVNKKRDAANDNQSRNELSIDAKINRNFSFNDCVPPEVVQKEYNRSESNEITMTDSMFEQMTMDCLEVLDCEWEMCRTQKSNSFRYNSDEDIQDIKMPSRETFTGSDRTTTPNMRVPILESRPDPVPYHYISNLNGPTPYETSEPPPCGTIGPPPYKISMRTQSNENHHSAKQTAGKQHKDRENDGYKTNSSTHSNRQVNQGRFEHSNIERLSACDMRLSQKSPIQVKKFNKVGNYGTVPEEKWREFHLQGKAVGLYNFKAHNSRELPFRKGDTIYLTGQIDANWFEGQMNGHVGIFPVSYVEVLTSTEEANGVAQKSEGQARAKYNFHSQTPVELSLKKGELVTILGNVDENWFEGRVGNWQGIFPVNYVDVLKEPSTPVVTPLPSFNTTPMTGRGTPEMPPPTPDVYKKTPAPPSHLSPRAFRSASEKSTYDDTKSRTVRKDQYLPPREQEIKVTSLRYNPLLPQQFDIQSQNGSRNPNHHSRWYRAIYAYQPQNVNELELVEGDEVYIMDKCDASWYVGTSCRTGMSGTFPGNYVTQILL